jgi:hypothetical protein
MATSTPLLCDGCGQPASPEHMTRRLQRLEWSTRYRPVHIQALLLGGVSPGAEEEFLYSPRGVCRGEAQHLLAACGIEHEGKSADEVLTEFQKRGLFLTHVLECPPDGVEASAAGLATLLSKRVPAVMARIRRSLKPKQVVLIGDNLETFAGHFLESDLGCSVLSDSGRPFALAGAAASHTVARLREALTGAVSADR